MQYLCIENKGEVDPQALTLLGASVKDDEKSIGFFGSGNKYALASVLRIGLELRIFSGEREILIETRSQTFRNEVFSVIYVDGQPTSITTRTGPKWGICDAIREFYSNARDEGDCGRFISNYPVGAASRTRIFLEMNDTVADMLTDWNKYFLPDDAIPLDDNREGRIFPPNPSNYFRKGVWICEDRCSMGYFTYDFKEFDLPESRKVSSHTVSSKISEVLRWCVSEEVFSTMLKHTTGMACYGEWSNMGWTTQNTGVLMALFKEKYDFIGLNSSREHIEDKTTKRILWCDDDAYRGLAYQGADKIESMIRAEDCYKQLSWPIGYFARVQSEICLLDRHGVDIDGSKVIFGTFNDPKTIAQYDKNKQLIVLSDKSFEFENLRKSLVEEWTHAKHNCVDGSTHQQHVYLDLICRLMEDKA
jgi:hypothetical protein